MNVKTKIATIMNEIGMTHQRLSEQYIALSGIMGEGVELASSPKLADAPAAVELPTTVSPQVPVIPATAIVPNVPTVNTAPNIPMVAPIAPDVQSTETLTPSAPTSSVELDDEGYPWDERIHASSKNKVKSKLVKGGQMWRIKQKCDPALVEQVRAEYKAMQSVDNNPAAPAAPAMAVPQAAPVVPVVPVVPLVDYQAIKAEGIASVNKLVNDYSVVYDDVLDALRDEFKIKDYEDLVDTQFQDVADFLSGLLNQYDEIHQLVLQMRQWGGDANAEGIDVNMLNIYGTAHAETLGAVHHSSLPAILVAVKAYHQQWVTNGFGA